MMAEVRLLEGGGSPCQPQDVYADCTMIRAEIEGNNVKIQQLADERGWKVTQNAYSPDSPVSSYR